MTDDFDARMRKSMRDAMADTNPPPSMRTRFDEQLAAGRNPRMVLLAVAAAVVIIAGTIAAVATQGGSRKDLDVAAREAQQSTTTTAEGVSEPQGIVVPAPITTTTSTAAATATNKPPATTSTTAAAPRPKGPGGRIVFSSNRDHSFGLFVVNPDGSGLTRLTIYPTWDSSPTRSPDGTLIAFTRTEPGDPGQNNFHTAVSILRPDGSVHPVSNPGTGINDLAPSWSPDGRQLVFERSDQQKTADTCCHLWVVNVDGTGEHQVTTANCGDSAPAWSPDGRTILFARSCQGGPSRLNRMNPDGTGIAAIGTQDDAGDAAWSPDGSRIAYVGKGSGAPGDDADVFVMRADGSGAERLVTGTQPAWAPDGSQIVFTSPTGLDAVVVADRSVRHITTNQPNSGFDGDADWSR